MAKAGSTLLSSNSLACTYFVDSVLSLSLCPDTAFSVLVAGQKGKYSPEPDDCNSYNPALM